jgi:hypothetical protein
MPYPLKTPQNAAPNALRISHGNSLVRSTPADVTNTKRLTPLGVALMRLVVPTRSVCRGPLSPCHLLVGEEHGGGTGGESLALRREAEGTRKAVRTYPNLKPTASTGTPSCRCSSRRRRRRPPPWPAMRGRGSRPRPAVRCRSDGGGGARGCEEVHVLLDCLKRLSQRPNGCALNCERTSRLGWLPKSSTARPARRVRARTL